MLLDQKREAEKVSGNDEKVNEKRGKHRVE